ncbi:MAG: hypothetical protein ACKVOE_08040 [Rickettsiales bacterium]
MQEIIQNLQNEFGLTPVMAAEIECYVLLGELTDERLDAFWKPIHDALREASHPLLRIEKERGDFQFELVTGITTPLQLEATLRTMRAWVTEQAERMGVAASFAAKPYAAQPSSGLHLHVHLADDAGVNVFHKTEEWTSDALRWSLGGMLANLPTDLAVFFPDETDFIRLDDPDHVPKIAGWGVNNRSCALRIPAIEDPYHKRIEHRVPCANANPEAAISALLAGVLRGLREKIEPPEQVHGKASAGLRESLGTPTGGR